MRYAGARGIRTLRLVEHQPQGKASLPAFIRFLRNNIFSTCHAVSIYTRIVDSYRMTLKTLLDSYRMTSLYLSCCKHLYPHCRFLQNDIFSTCHAVSIYTRIVDYRMTLKALIDSYRMTSLYLSRCKHCTCV